MAQRIPLEQAAPCLACGYCRDGCPIARHIGWPIPQFLPVARTLNNLTAKAIVASNAQELLSQSDDMLANINLCIGCQYCKEVCPNGIDFPMLIEQSRAALRQSGLGNAMKLERMVSNIGRRVTPMVSRPLPDASG